VFFQQYAFVFLIAPVLLVSLYLVIYSYVEYRKEIR
jgi:hypothetical protein